MSSNHAGGQRSKVPHNARQAAARRKARRKKLFRRRAAIVTVGILIIAVVVTLLVLFIKGIAAVNDNVRETQPPTIAATQAPSENFTFDTPDIKYDKNLDGSMAESNSEIYIYNKSAFEVFTGTTDTAQRYADCISDFKKTVGDSVTVYNMVVPNHTEYALPQQIISDGKVKTVSQADNIKEIYTKYTQSVVPVNCYNVLSEHNKEYIYFNTDKHWTGLGAYYAYTAFCEKSNNKILDLGVCNERTIEGFEGSYIDSDSLLRENLDTVHFWTFPYTTYAVCTDESEDSPYETSVYYEAEESGPYSYGVFIWGDSPLFVEHNKDLSNGKKIAVVKDSYGNAFVPYLTANYEQVHVIDFALYKNNITSYCKQNNITEVLFINSILTTNSTDKISTLRTLFN